MNGKMSFWTTSETGLVRKDNQDSVFISGDGTVFCVADGMGGGCEGALASRMVCDEIQSEIDSGAADRVAAVERAIASADERIRNYAREKGFKQMGSTVVLLLIDPDSGRCASICHVGDSRVYRIRNGKVDQLTDDHTLGNQIMNMSDAKWATRLGSRSNPLSHILTNAVGSGEKVAAEWKKLEVLPGDRYLLCSDGVHDVLDEDGISEIFEAVDTVSHAGERMRELIIEGGAPDNFSYIVIQTGEQDEK
jgi:protein phosphatase